MLRGAYEVPCIALQHRPKGKLCSLSAAEGSAAGEAPLVGAKELLELPVHVRSF
jgi:hypothetical protein